MPQTDACKSASPPSPLRCWLPGRRWLPIFILLALVMTAVWFNLGQRSLASLTLPDGTRLKVWAVTTGEFHRFTVRNQIPPDQLLPSWMEPWQGEFTLGDGNPGGVILWLSRISAWTERPLDPGEVAWLVAVDQDGWPHPVEEIWHNTLLVGKEASAVTGIIHGPKLTFDGGRSSAPEPLDGFGPLSDLNYRNVIHAVRFPAMTGDSFLLQAYDRSGQLLAESRVPIPGNPNQISPAPVPQSPVAQEVNGLAVTLHGITRISQESEFPGLRPSRIVPNLSLSWRGGDAAGWEFGNGDDFEVGDVLGNKSDPDLCMLSPQHGPWTLDLEIYRKPQSALRPGQRVRTKRVAIPPDGEARDGDAIVEADGVRMQLLKLFGKGKHKLLLNDQRFSGYGMSTYSDSDNGVTEAKIDRSRSGAAIEVDAERFTALIALENTENKSAKIVIVGADGERFQAHELDYSTPRLVGFDEPTQLLVVWPKERELGLDPGSLSVAGIPQTPDEIEFEITIDRPMKYRFLIQPPELPSQK